MKREGLFKDFIWLNIRFNQEHIKKIERKIAFCKIALVTNKIKGDYLEFGYLIIPDKKGVTVYE
ncbi:MAG: hypothetical protein KAW47_09255 [Thermoplasmatales archaeon]|nr:hypothetical protein [Thermoplasmatales archaeon]